MHAQSFSVTIASQHVEWHVDQIICRSYIGLYPGISCLFYSSFISTKTRDLSVVHASFSCSQD